MEVYYQDLTDVDPVPAAVQIQLATKVDRRVTPVRLTIVPVIEVPMYKPQPPTAAEIEEGEQARGDHEPMT